MKLSLLAASLATVLGVFADEAVIYEKADFRGNSLKHVSSHFGTRAYCCVNTA